MIIGYDRPALTYTLTHGTFATDSARLTNGRPASRTRFEITPDLSNLLIIQADFGSVTIKPGMAGIVGTDLPVGATVTCDFIRTGDGSYGYLPVTSAVVQRRDGVRCCWFAVPETATSNVHGVRFQLSVGAVPLTAGVGYVEIGEIWVSPSLRHCVLTDYKRTLVSNSEYASSVSGQPFSTRRQQSHQHVFSLAPDEWSLAFGNQANDLAYIQQALTKHSPAAMLPYQSAPFGGLHADDQAIINQHTAFGYFDEVGTEEYDKGCVVQFSGLKFTEPAA